MFCNREHGSQTIKPKSTFDCLIHASRISLYNKHIWSYISLLHLEKNIPTACTYKCLKPYLKSHIVSASLLYYILSVSRPIWTTQYLYTLTLLNSCIVCRNSVAQVRSLNMLSQNKYTPWTRVRVSLLRLRRVSGCLSVSQVIPSEIQNRKWGSEKASSDF